MLRLLDGPAEGSYAVKRAPLYLRAVVDEGTGKADVLDQLHDTPRPTERVHVYKLQGEAGYVRVCFTGPRHGEGYATGDYLQVADVDGEQFRETAAWREWVIQQTRAPVNPQTGEIVNA